MPEMNPFPRPQNASLSQQVTNPTAPKSHPSVISRELKIVGNLHTTDEIIIEGKVEGDLSALSVIIKESAEFEGHIRVDEATIDGSLKGEIRGKKIRLNKTARVAGNIIHGNIQIEAGAHFEGNVKRSEDPIGLKPKKSSPNDKQTTAPSVAPSAKAPSAGVHASPSPSTEGLGSKGLNIPEPMKKI